MDSEDFRSILESAGADVWTLIDTAIAVASVDHGDELKRRRDGIVERLYVASSAPPRCRNCEPDDGEIKTRNSPSAAEAKDPHGGLVDDEQMKILEIKEQLEDPHQSEDSLVELLQNLADMDITFQALGKTDIGRHVNRLRKHSSNDVKRLVKLLVRKWKEIVDEWVKSRTTGEAGTAVMADGDSPQQKSLQNGHRQVEEIFLIIIQKAKLSSFLIFYSFLQILDFAYSPNPHNGSFGSEINNIEPQQLKPKAIPRKEAPPKPPPSVTNPAPAPQNRQSVINIDLDRFDSARKRLQENYKEAANAKKQRTIQVMDLHDLPKPKNAFFGKNKGGNGQGRH
ncbi:probable mediator of RNA polymerase II transcription subunit 26c isoform X1 [Cajanus cajan]|uniref:probable mediator of RNA polymerase II transcription subunit 26c isoform X1 n=1 Tax=Cajanus cajan TaxID=3821 RepID=UPI00098DC46E|nr:probable mediator of RNA polymerase II transcription subunit 26c isoform X1 [Cajanus cajan]